MDVKSPWIPIWHQMDHGSWSLGLFQKPPLGGRPNTKLGDRGIVNAHNHYLFYFIIMIRMNRNSMKYHLVEGPVTNDFTLHLRVHDHTA